VAGQPDLDAALDFYTGLVDLVRGKVTAATGAAELNAALATVLVGMGRRSTTARFAPSSAYGCPRATRSPGRRSSCRRSATSS
jgi:hypothetical protein